VESHELPQGGVTITAAPSQHFSGRTPGTGNASLWSSSWCDRESQRLFSGDTGLTDEYRDIRARLGPSIS
jgi:L-ascorbate metabolism protein UlaG (beta-lactamase superfamily)